MAAKKKRSVRKQVAKRKPATLKTQNLAVATAASVKAVLGKGAPRRPGILAGIWLEEAVIARLDVSPKAAAAAIAKEASARSGFNLKPGLIPGDGGILVGFFPPAILKR